MKHHKFRTTQGFTLVELLLVLGILATLAAIVYPSLAGRSEQGKVGAAKLQISNIEEALDLYETENGNFPKNLNALQEQPGDAPNWKGPYLKKGIPLDPWGNAYIYEYPGKHNANSFDLLSTGPDGRPGTDDDINNWDVNKK